MNTERGQVIIIVAVLLTVLLLFLAVLIDGARLFIEQQEINRALDAAGKAGLIVVGDRMLTQVVAAQTAAASITPNGNAPALTPSLTPEPNDFHSWLSDEHHQTLVAPVMQTVVAINVLGSLEENGLGLDNSNVIDIAISYPDNYQADDQALEIKLELDRRVVIIFGGLLNIKEGVISGSSRQTISQR